MIFSKTEAEALAPRTVDYALRCDLYDAADLIAGAFDSVYVVVALGPCGKPLEASPAFSGLP